MDLLLAGAILVFYGAVMMLCWRVARSWPGEVTHRSSRIIRELHPQVNRTLLISGFTVAACFAASGEWSAALSTATALTVMLAYGGRTLRN